MTAPVIIPRAEPAYEGAILLDQDSTALIAVRTAEPGAEALTAAEGPLLLDLHNLGIPTVGEGDLRVTPKTSNPDTWMVLQELTVAPLLWPR